MKFQGRKEHAIDFAFALALFFVFAASALTVVIVSLQSYSGITDQAEKNYSARTSMSYLTQKVRHMDRSGAIRTGELDGISALIMDQDFEGEIYSTYIYQYENQLMELFVKSGTEIDPGEGSSITQVDTFLIEPLSPGLYNFYIKDADNQVYNQTVTLRTSN